MGSPGNIESTAYIQKHFQQHGWNIELQQFAAFDWQNEGAYLEIQGRKIEVHSSPYALGCDVEGPIVIVTSLDQLRVVQARGAILVVKEDLASEQLMPKNFVFYNPDSHKEIVNLLERSEAEAVLFIVNRRGHHAGGEYPFPIIEDGDFDIPSVFMAEERAIDLETLVDQRLRLVSRSKRIPSHGCNVLATLGNPHGKRIVISAHLDAKRGSPGAIDNATGIAVLLQLAECLRDYQGPLCVELAALNGEDYYSVPGQMRYIELSKNRFNDTLLNINIDGAGLINSAISWSLFNLPEILEQQVRNVLDIYPSLVEGKPWVQGDHSIFLQHGVPAIAISSEWLINHLEEQDITHTSKDTVEIVDCSQLSTLVMAIRELIWQGF